MKRRTINLAVTGSMVALSGVRDRSNFGFRDSIPGVGDADRTTVAHRMPGIGACRCHHGCHRRVRLPTNRIVTQRRLHNYAAQFAAKGYRVTIEPAA